MFLPIMVEPEASPQGAPVAGGRVAKRKIPLHPYIKHDRLIWTSAGVLVRYQNSNKLRKRHCLCTPTFLSALTVEALTFQSSALQTGYQHH